MPIQMVKRDRVMNASLLSIQRLTDKYYADFALQQPSIVLKGRARRNFLQAFYRDRLIHGCENSLGKLRQK